MEKFVLPWFSRIIPSIALFSIAFSALGSHHIGIGVAPQVSLEPQVVTRENWAQRGSWRQYFGPKRASKRPVVGN